MYYCTNKIIDLQLDIYIQINSVQCTQVLKCSEYMNSLEKMSTYGRNR